LANDAITIPRWAVVIGSLALGVGTLFLPVLTIVTISTFGWVWKTNSDMAVMQRDVAQIRMAYEDIKALRDEQNRRANQAVDIADLKQRVQALERK
jgi:hypothetical protein